MPKLYTDVCSYRRRLSIRMASKEYAVPKSTLNEHLTGKVPEGARWGSNLFPLQRKKLKWCNVTQNERSKGILLKQGKPSDMWWR